MILVSETRSQEPISVMNNISEGFCRSGDAEFKRFLNISKGSVGEVKNMYYIAEDQQYISGSEALLRRNKSQQLMNSISKFIKYLKTSLNNKDLQDLHDLHDLQGLHDLHDLQDNLKEMVKFLNPPRCCNNDLPGIDYAGDSGLWQAAGFINARYRYSRNNCCRFPPRCERQGDGEHCCEHYPRNLLQVQGIDNIESESRNGSALIRLSFRFGNDIDLAFMEVNEKIDGAMNNLPRDLERPRIIKASATDIPVFLLNTNSC